MVALTTLTCVLIAVAVSIYQSIKIITVEKRGFPVTDSDSLHARVIQDTDTVPRQKWGIPNIISGGITQLIPPATTLPLISLPTPVASALQGVITPVLSNTTITSLPEITVVPTSFPTTPDGDLLASLSKAVDSLLGEAGKGAVASEILSQVTAKLYDVVESAAAAASAVESIAINTDGPILSADPLGAIASVVDEVATQVNNAVNALGSDVADILPSDLIAPIQSIAASVMNEALTEADNLVDVATSLISQLMCTVEEVTDGITQVIVKNCAETTVASTPESVSAAPTGPA